MSFLYQSIRTCWPQLPSQGASCLLHDIGRRVCHKLSMIGESATKTEGNSMVCVGHTHIRQSSAGTVVVHTFKTLCTCDTPARNRLRLCSEGKFLSHSCSNGFGPVLTTSKVPQNTRSTFSARCCREARPGIGLPSF
jgi:hypothetical protein